MTDYTKTTNFTAKDALSTGDPEKLILGSDVDTEFDNIATAVATKYDVNDLASQAQAEAETANTVLMTPLRLANWADANGGMVGDIQALADPGADRILFWDDGAGAAAALTATGGIEISATNLQLTAASAGAGLTLTAGVYAVGAGTGITVNANDVAITAIAATTSQPMSMSGGAFDFEIDALTNMEGSALAATDEIIVSDGGVNKAIAVQDMGMRVQLAQTTQTLAAADMNSIMEFTATATLTLPLNATVDLPVGVPIVLNMKHATQVLTVTAAASVTLVSPFHPAGAAAESDTVVAGGTALLYKTAADVWCLSGDIST
jgi:hypothetical protein